ncbi:hypothetical protein ACS28H_003792, partial [Escherichia coli]
FWGFNSYRSRVVKERPWKYPTAPKKSQSVA